MLFPFGESSESRLSQVSCVEEKKVLSRTRRASRLPFWSHFFQSLRCGPSVYFKKCAILDTALLLC